MFARCLGRKSVCSQERSADRRKRSADWGSTAVGGIARAKVSETG